MSVLVAASLAGFIRSGPAAASEGTKKARLVLTKVALRKGEPRLLQMSTSLAAQVDLMTALAVCCGRKKPLGEIFEHLALQLYELDGDVLCEEAVFSWAEHAACEPETSVAHRFLQQSKAFLEWLREADDDSD